jgi:hypothetical protein
VENRPSWWSRFTELRRYPYTIGLAVLLMALAGTFLKSDRIRDWDKTYLKAAHLLRNGEDIYRLEDGYLYPPIMAWLLTPFTYLSTAQARLGWFAVNAVGVFLLLRWAWRLSGGGALEGARTAGWRQHLICLVGLACGLRFVIDSLAHHQTDVLVGALVLGGCLALLGKRVFVAATCLGLAAGIKCTPLLWAAYLLWKREWLAAGWLVVVAVGVNLLPNLASSPPQGGWWLGVWLQRYLLPLSEAGRYPGVWGSSILMNQSLAGASFRWCVTNWHWTSSEIEIVTRSGPMDAGLLRLVLYGVQGGLVLAVAALINRHEPGLARSSDTTRTALEFSAVLLLMVLLSPMSSKPHFWTMLLPGFCLARRAVERRHSWLWPFLIGSLALNILSTQGLVGSRLASVSLWYGLVTGSAFTLLVGCALDLGRERRLLASVRAGPETRLPSASEVPGEANRKAA